MRLWHKDLISVLPREQLVAQWRELSAIAGAIQKNGTPNHGLVNFVLDYGWNHFISYAYYIRKEMTDRSYKTMNKVWEKIVSLNPNYHILPIELVYEQKMNNEYLEICYWNLREKYLCNIIKEEDWEKIYWRKWHELKNLKEINNA